MKRVVGWVVLVVGVGLALACGSGGGEDQPAADIGGGLSVEEGEAPPAATAVVTPSAVATPTGESAPSEAGNLREQVGELVLSEDDVPAGFSALGSMDLDFGLDFLDLPSPQTWSAHMSLFATPESEDMIVSMVVLVEDDTILQEAFSQMDDLSIEELQEAFSMMGTFMDVTLLDTRELDVSGLGDKAYGMGLTMEVPQVGTMDSEMVFFGDGSLLAVAMTMAMSSGTAVDAVPLAQTMADKIEAVVQ